MTIINRPRSEIRVGSRGSKLALAQANSIIKVLRENNPGIKIRLVTIKTAGDSDRDSLLDKTGTVGFFTKQIEIELLNDKIDIAVHSAKDLPSTLTDGLVIAGVPSRGPVEDVLLSNSRYKLRELKSGSIMGTGSPRRRAMLLNCRPDLAVKPIRGNIETRLRKLHNGDYDAIILARAGMSRIGLEKSITEVLPVDDFLPAPGQGALAIQIRSQDDAMMKPVGSIDDPISHRCLNIERLFLRRMDIGCSAAVGGLAIYENGRFHLRTAIYDKDGRSKICETYSITRDQPDEVFVEEIINRLISQGANDLIAE